MKAIIWAQSASCAGVVHAPRGECPSALLADILSIEGRQPGNAYCYLFGFECIVFFVLQRITAPAAGRTGTLFSLTIEGQKDRKDWLTPLVRLLALPRNTVVLAMVQPIPRLPLPEMAISNVR